ncbi:kinase-like domain-containing protein [Roridomyces roridus]|uniref:Kinase-like domain-containing protein n=1 Tax=Roridomyces roridus TaxID=1738132 RepID=A0AAD7F9L3_9AGAR|nr:kinase-like domain-containing protein [Roridomyces roridus]
MRDGFLLLLSGPRPTWPLVSLKSHSSRFTLALRSHIPTVIQPRSLESISMFATRSIAMKSTTLSLFQKIFRKKTPSVDPKALLDTTSFDPLFKIGEGSSSSVLLVKDKTYGRHLALKMVPHTAGTAVNEQQIHSQLAGLADVPRTLLPLLASWQDAEKSYLLTEWCAGRDLMTILGAGHRLTPEHAKLYAAQLVTAIETLHRAGIAHCDLKPSNVFLTKDGNIVLGDYGRAKSFAAPPQCSAGKSPKCLQGHSTDRCGTPYWSSPAQHAGLPYSFDADIWSLGLLVHRMTTGRMPFGNRAKNVVEIKAAYAMEDIEFREADGLDENTKDLIRQLLRKDGDDRPHILQVKEHPYFQEVDWAAVAHHEAPVPWVPVKPYIPTTVRPKLLPRGGPCAFDSHVREFYYVSSQLSAPPPGPVKRSVKKVCKSATQVKRKVGTLPSSTREVVIKGCELISRLFGLVKTSGSAGQKRGDNEKTVNTRWQYKIDLNDGHVQPSSCSGPSLSARIGEFLRRRFHSRVKVVDLRKIELD